MTTFAELLAIAIVHLGDAESLEAALPKPLTADALARLRDDRILSAMARCLFRAGFSWRVIDDKWPAFEQAFAGFQPLAVAHFSDEKLDHLASDTRIVRHRAKIGAVRDNAVYVVEVQRRHGSFARFLADWPEDDTIGLWLTLKRQGSRLGGNTGPMVLRTVGRDTFILSGDVQAALRHHGFVDRLNVNARRDLLQVQAVFHRLREESGRSLAEISRILAYTV